MILDPFFLDGDNRRIGFYDDKPSDYLQEGDLFDVVAQGPFVAARYSVGAFLNFTKDLPGIGVRWMFELTKLANVVAGNAAYIGGGLGGKPDPTHLIYVMGDSISADNVTEGGYGGGAAMKPYLNTNSSIVWGYYNASKAGAHTSDFLQGAAIYTEKVLPMYAHRALYPNREAYCLVPLGTNDARQDVLSSPAQFAANITAIIAQNAARSIKTILMARPLAPVGALGMWNAQGPLLQGAYNTLLPSLADGVNSFLGDTSLPGKWVYQMHSVDQVHPNALGKLILGQTASDALVKVAFPLPDNTAILAAIGALPTPPTKQQIAEQVALIPEIAIAGKKVEITENGIVYKNANNSTFKTQSKTISGETVTVGPLT